jgi:hypothetical protein
MRLEAETKKLEKEVEHLLEQVAVLRKQEGTAQLHEVVESQADRRALNREQEELVRLQQRDLPSNRVCPSWDEPPDKLRQQEWNGKPKQQRRIDPSGAGTSFCE